MLSTRTPWCLLALLVMGLIYPFRLLSRESPSGTLKAVLRKASNSKGEEKQFLEVSPSIWLLEESKGPPVIYD